MKRIGQWMPLFAVCLALSGVCFSRASSSSLQGSVTDPSGSAIAGATVTLADATSRTERTTVTGQQGEYRFLAVPPGTYSLSVTFKGFAHYVQNELQLLVNTPGTANVCNSKWDRRRRA